ncbi:MAG: hypothetical protein OHK0026_14300 [Rhodocyclaceae bacterium]
MLAQMRAMADAAGSAAPGPGGAAGVDFGQVLKGALDEVVRAQGQTQEMAREFSAGSPQVSLQDVMINLQKASLSFQQIVQVRNRLVSAYQEIINMPL